MPRGGAAPEQQSCSTDHMADELVRWARAHSTGNRDEGFLKETAEGLFVGLGQSEFLFRPYSGTVINPNRFPVDLDHLDKLSPAKLEALCSALRSHAVNLHINTAGAVSGLFSFKELRALEALKKPESVIEGLTFEGETSILAGRAKVGKTRLIYQAALAIACGGEFLGMRVPSPKRVLLVDLENRPWALRDRLIRMSGKTVDIPGLHIWCTNSLLTDGINATPEGTAKLKTLVEDVQPDVLFIDPWRLFLAGDENDATDVLRGLKALSAMRDVRPGLTIHVVHHTRKDQFENPRKLLAEPRLWVENISGHSAFPGHVDSILGLERDRDSNGEELIVFGGISRNMEPTTFILEDDEDSLRFEVQQGDTALQSVMTPRQQEIWQAAVKLRTFRFTELVSASKATSEKTVTVVLRKAEKYHLAKKLDRGRYEVVIEHV